MYKWCGDSKIEMYVKYTRPAKYRGTTIGCEKCRAKCQLLCTFHFHQCRQKSRNSQWAAELWRNNPWFQLFLCAQQKECIKEQKNGNIRKDEAEMSDRKGSAENDSKRMADRKWSTEIGRRNGRQGAADRKWATQTNWKPMRACSGVLAF